jgi:hypothetical protein
MTPEDGFVTKLDQLQMSMKNMYSNTIVSQAFLKEFIKSCMTHPKLPEPLPEGVVAVKRHLETLELLDECKLYHVAADYYEWSLEKRA